MKEIFGRIEQFRPDMYYAGVRSKIIPTAPAGEVFVGDSYNGVTMPDTGQTADVNNFAPRLGSPGMFSAPAKPWFAPEEAYSILRGCPVSS